MSVEDIVDLWHRRGTSRKDLPLQCKCPSHDSFVIQELCIGIDLILPVDTPLIGWSADCTAVVDSELSASSNEVDCAAVEDAWTSIDLEASSDHETTKDPNAPSS